MRPPLRVDRAAGLLIVILLVFAVRADDEPVSANNSAMAVDLASFPARG